MKNIRLAIACLAIAMSTPTVLHAQAAGAAAVQDSKEIALAPKWMPDKRAMGEQSIKAMAFYARAALDGAEPGKEIVPTKILSGAGWDLDWLMPLREAEKRLPPSVRMQMGGATVLKNGTWPQSSIYVKSGQGKFYMPGFETEVPSPAVYLEVFLICDQKQRLIGVEVRADDRKGPSWNSLKMNNPAPRKGSPAIGGMPMMGGPLGVQRLNPYYDLMALGANAVDGRDVEYQIIRNRDNPVVVVPGMTCIHTYLAPLRDEIGNFKRNVRLYLAAPFARKLVDIAEMYEKATGKSLSP